MTFFQAPKLHDFSQFVLTIGGVLIGGFGEDGGVEYEWVEDIGESTIGADGLVEFERNNDKRLIATVTLKASGSGYGRLVALMKGQQQLNSITPLPYESFNPQTGERVTSAYSIFQTRPEPNAEKSAMERETDILLPSPEFYGPGVAALGDVF